MKDNIKALADIERNYLTESIKINGEAFWPIVRSFVFNQLLDDRIAKHSASRFFQVVKFKNFFLGFAKWFRRVDYVILSNEMERKNLNGIYIDKLVEGFVEEKGINNILYIEQVKTGHASETKYRERRVSLDFHLIVTGLYLKIFGRFQKIHLEGRDVIEKIISDNKFETGYENSILTFLGKAFVFGKILDRIRPKALIITDYGYSWATYAAKKRGIKVIEYQHGVIGNAHPYYHPAKKMDAKFSPDYLLVFGLLDKQALSHGNYVANEHIFPVGNFYLSALLTANRSNTILKLIEGYTWSVCVPTDDITHDFLMSFISRVAVELPECIFIITPRNAEAQRQTRDLPSNVKVVPHSFQEVVRHCDVHTATNSTCCLEALTLGARNILIDADGLASQYFGAILNDTNFTLFVKTEEEYVEKAKSLKKITREATSHSNRNNYMSSHIELLRDFLKVGGV